MNELKRAIKIYEEAIKTRNMILDADDNSEQAKRLRRISTPESLVMIDRIIEMSEDMGLHLLKKEIN